METLDLDLYDEAVLRDSREAFAQIREAGPVVWLEKHRIYAIGRFEDVRAALKDDTVFRSGKGVAANGLTNRLGRDTTLFSDDEVHGRRRKVLMRALGQKALVSTAQTVREEASKLVADLADRSWFEASRDFSSHLPLAVVADLVGVRADGDRLLRWAAATFDTLGPMNRRGMRAASRTIGLFLFSQRVSAGKVRPGSWAASVFEAQQRGELSRREAKALVIDFVAPALDTTILASTHLLWALGRYPDAWSELREEPELLGRAVVENVRLSSPIRGFTRTVAEDHEVAGDKLPAGSRVALLFGAANLDETAFQNPEEFDIQRENRVQLGWGHGPHTCVGIHLAKLEMNALLEAMVPRVESVETGEPERLANNTLQGIASMQTRFAAA